MWICVQYGSVHVDMCTVWISTCGYVYSMDQYMWICVQYGSVHVDMCTVWISTCGYVQYGSVHVDMCTVWISTCGYAYSMDQYMWICVQYGMDQYMWIHTYVYSMDQYMWIHTYVYSMDQYMWICVQYGSGQQVIHTYLFCTQTYVHTSFTNVLSVCVQMCFVYECALCKIVPYV